MAYTGKYTSDQIDALLDALLGDTAGYYTSQYNGEDIDAAVTKVNDGEIGNDALKTAINALAIRVAALEGGSA